MDRCAPVGRRDVGQLLEVVAVISDATKPLSVSSSNFLFWPFAYQFANRWCVVWQFREQLKPNATSRQASQPHEKSISQRRVL
jgi:hypothetical protein